MTTADTLTDQCARGAHTTSVSEGLNPRGSQAIHDAQAAPAVPGFNTPSTKAVVTSKRLPSAEPNPPSGQSTHDTRGALAAGGTTSCADQKGGDAQLAPVSAGTHIPGDQRISETQCSDITGDPNVRNGHTEENTQASIAVRTPNPQPTKGHVSPKDVASADGSGQPDPASAGAAPKNLPPDLADPLLALAADVLDDLERVRIANENRLRQLTRDETDKDGEERGFGLTLDHPDVARLAALVEALSKAEHSAELNLKHMLRRHPLGPWMRQARGIGEKQGARLLAAIGDPYWNELHNRPRIVSELWSYCGYSVHRFPVSQSANETQAPVADGDRRDSPTSLSTSARQVADDTRFRCAGGNGDSNPDQGGPGTHSRSVGVAVSRQRGVKVNWSPIAKMRAFLIAEKVVQTRGYCRDVYDHGREKYATAVHDSECKRCGPAGKPAPIGSPLSAGHQHARAVRLVAKTVLRDLWREARRIHQDSPSDQHPIDNQAAHVAGVPHSTDGAQ